MRLLIICAVVILTSHIGNAKIDYKPQYNIKQIPVAVCKEKPRKSVRQIIKEILKGRKANQNHYQAPSLDLDLNNTIPIPTEDALENLKNLA